ncbi:MAG: YihY family inner membrane protein [Deltaproteobacteria bacterium]|nr:YihY family inner membrane protein [Deltaproteobacteria bacterium]
MTIFSKIFGFIQRGIWEIHIKDLPKWKAVPLRYLRVLFLAGYGFWKDDCQKNASMLTYYSLLNIVPLMAVAFGIAKGFGLEKIIEKHILQIAAKGNWSADVTNQLLAFSRSMLEHVKGGIVAGVGVLVLFWTVISILGKIEESLNEIWDVRRTRSLTQKFTDYITMIVFAPILFVVSSSATVLVASHLKAVMNKIAALGFFGYFFLILLNILPYVSMWTLLTLVYIVLPNTKVPVRSGILGAFAAGTVFQIVQWLYIKFQIGVTKFGAIYGSFAALPLFLIWLQAAWMIILFGAEIAHANEHYETFGFHPDYSRISQSSKKVLVLRIFRLIALRFAHAENPLNVKEISNMLKIPVRLVSQLLNELIEAGLVVEVSKGVKEQPAFQPARPIEGLTLKTVIDAYEKKGDAYLPDTASEEVDRVLFFLGKIAESIESSPGNVQVREI